MKHKKLIAIVTLLLFALTLFPSAAFAATPGTKVTATIPTFKVTMNGQVVDNTYRQYPFLVYNDITYFPMTYWDMRFLGVSNTWSAETGSVIVADGNTSEYKPTLTDVKNKTKNTAVVNTGAFKVNGKIIDNAKEEYPILSFRDVPYFPLTWSWCQEFGWNISFDGTNGLAVNTTKQTPSKNVNNEPATSNTTEVYKITADELQDSSWVADNTNSIEIWGFFRDDENGSENVYVHFRQTMDASNTIIRSLAVQEGSYILSNDSLILTQEKEETVTQDITGKESSASNDEKRTFTYSVKGVIKDGKQLIYIDGHPYYNMSIDETNDVLHNRQSQWEEQAESIIASKKPNSADYAYLAGDDFRRIQSKYSTAEAQYAYVYAYENIDGDLCVLTHLRYKIINNYDAFVLHNITTGETISEPDDYYEKIMDRYYGANRLYYGDLYSEVLGNEIKMIQAGIDILKTGNNTFDGVFVDAKTLNM